MKQLKGGSKSTFWVKLPEELDESSLYYPWETRETTFNGVEAFNTTSFGGKLHINEYIRSDENVTVPPQTYNGSYTTYLDKDAFKNAKTLL